MVLRYQKPRNEAEFLLFYGNIKKNRIIMILICYLKPLFQKLLPLK